MKPNPRTSKVAGGSLNHYGILLGNPFPVPTRSVAIVEDYAVIFWPDIDIRNDFSPSCPLPTERVAIIQDFFALQLPHI
ncbi:MAG TPA: hypothetical protein VHZ52_05875 [Acidobacteriaceae bacterium]|jgi:hypothetical protein|nr:hypothetical protein [Acidobacteriaceae bacterium]